MNVPDGLRVVTFAANLPRLAAARRLPGMAAKVYNGGWRGIGKLLVPAEGLEKIFGGNAARLLGL